MSTVQKELGSKLSDIVGVRVVFPLSDNKDLILKVFARLFLLYNDQWDVEPSSSSCKEMQRLLNVVGIGHLCPTPSDLFNRHRLPRLWSAFVDHLEQKYGGHGLYPRLRKVLKQQQIMTARRQAERQRQQRADEGTVATHNVSSCSTASQSSQDSGVRFARPDRPRCLSTISSSSSTASACKQGRSKIPVLSRYNTIPTGRQLSRTPSLKRPVDPPPGSPAAAGLATAIFATARASPAAAAAAASPAADTREGRPTHPRLSQLVVANKRLSCTGVSYDLTEMPSVRHSADDSPTLVRPETSSDTPRRRSLVPVAVTPERALGEYIEHQLNAHFKTERDDWLSDEVFASGKPRAANAPPKLDRPDSAERPALAAVESLPELELAAYPGATELTANKENVEPLLAAGAVDSGAESGGGDSDKAVLRTSTSQRRSTFDVPPKAAGIELNSTAAGSVPAPVPAEERREQPASRTASPPPSSIEAEPAVARAQVIATVAPAADALVPEAAAAALPKDRRSRPKVARGAHPAAGDVTQEAAAAGLPSPEEPAVVDARRTEKIGRSTQRRDGGAAVAQSDPAEAATTAKEQTSSSVRRGPKTRSADGPAAGVTPATEAVGTVLSRASESVPAARGGSRASASGAGTSLTELLPAKRRGRGTTDDQETHTGKRSVQMEKLATRAHPEQCVPKAETEKPTAGGEKRSGRGGRGHKSRAAAAPPIQPEVDEAGAGQGVAPSAPVEKPRRGRKKAQQAPSPADDAADCAASAGGGPVTRASARQLQKSAVGPEPAAADETVAGCGADSTESRRAEKASRKAAVVTPAKASPERRRPAQRLRIVLDSDSDCTPPEPAPVRRGRKTVGGGGGQHRRVLGDLQNCH